MSDDKATTSAACRTGEATLALRRQRAHNPSGTTALDASHRALSGPATL